MIVGLCALVAGCEAPSPIERLAEGTPYALVEARLSGPFPDTECPGSTATAPTVCSLPEVGTEEFEALAAATAAVQVAEGRDAPRARALAELMWSVGELGSAAAAAEALEALTRERPADPDALSDWAAAELTRGAAEGRAYPNVLALEAAERALALAPDHAPARYNRALALDRLGFRDLSAWAWSAVVELDRASLWSRRAQERRARIVNGFPTEENEPALRREVVLDSLMPAWGNALRSGDEERARRLLNEARKHAAGLDAASVPRAVDRVQRIWEASPSEARRVALALEEFGAGRERYEAQDDSLAVQHLAAAEVGFGSLAPELRDWASVWRSAAELGLTRYEEVEERLAPIMERHELTESPVLVGLAGWLRGVGVGRRGEYGVALRHHQTAARAMSLSGETGYIAFLWSLVAEDQTLLGNPLEAWEARTRSLEVFRRVHDPSLLRGALVPAVVDLQRSGMLHAALLLQNHAVELSEAGMADYLLSEDLVRRATLRLELGREAAAEEDLKRARAVATSIRDGATRDWSMAQLWIAEGALAARSSREDADQASVPLALLDSAVAFHRSRNHNHFLVDLHLERSRLHQRRGALEDAHQELRASLTLVENTRSTIDDPVGGIRFAEASRKLWDAGLGLDLVARRDPWSALRLMERIRSLTTPWLEVPSSQELARVSHLPDLAVVAYASLPDSLFVWILRDSGAEALSLPVARETLRDAGLELGRHARSARSPEELWPAAERVTRLILPDTLQALIGARDVVFVPDPVVAGLPFAALTSREGWLLEERAVSVSPSLTFVQTRLGALAAEAGRGGGRALLVGDATVHPGIADRYPPLPAAPEELARLRELYPEASVLQGRKAHADALLQGLDETVEVLHFAGHAVSAPEVPGGSHLVLAPGPDHGGGQAPEDGLLFAHALARQGFQGPELVVLTACSSVAPRPGSLGGFQGIAVPFLERGTSAVLGTLWEVEDEGAASIASAFHAGWVEGLSAREALRQAQLAGLRAGGVPPRVWAAFQLVGIAGNARSGSVPTTAQALNQEGELDGIRVQATDDRGGSRVERGGSGSGDPPERVARERGGRPQAAAKEAQGGGRPTPHPS